MNRRLFAALVLAATTLPSTNASSAGQDCEALQRLSLTSAGVTGVQVVAAGALTVTQVPKGTEKTLQSALARLSAFCRVMISAKPGPGSDIRIEVWLPASGWNGRLQAVGDGGLAGYIPFSLMAEAFEAGYATTGTDTGHVGASADFMPGTPDKLLDFAYRSTHERAKAAKTVVAAHYGKPAVRSYYNACSGGRHGRKLVKEAGIAVD